MNIEINYLLVAVLAIFAIALFIGARKGFLRILFSLVSGIFLIALMSLAAPHINTMLKEKTDIHDKVAAQCKVVISEKMGDAIGDTVLNENLTGISIPAAAGAYIVSGGEDLLDSTGIMDGIAARAADLVITGISFLVTLLLSSLIVALIGRAVGIVDDIPVIGTLNRLAGLVLGGIFAMMIVSVLFLVIALMAPTETGTMLMKYIDGNPLLEYLYYKNILVGLLVK